MEESDKTTPILRRDFLRGVAGGALAMGVGPLLAADRAQAASAAPIRLFLSTFLAGSVMEIHILTDGTVTVKTFAQFGIDALGRPETTAGLVVGPNDNLFVFSPGSDQIFLLDVNTGARKRTITGITTSHNGAIGPDGHLYVVNAPSLNAGVGSSAPDTIERFDASTGDHIDTFISSNTTPEIRAPFGLTWGPDGDLYVAGVLAYGFNPNDFPFRPDHISHFDGKTGEFKAFAVRQSHLSFTLAFHPNGQLLVPSHFFNRVYMYDASNSRMIDAFVDVPFPIGIAFGPDGDLYVASFSNQGHLNNLLDTNPSNDLDALGAGSIMRFDGRTGSARPGSTVVAGLPFAGYLAFA